MKKCYKIISATQYSELQFAMQEICRNLFLLKIKLDNILIKFENFSTKLFTDFFSTTNYYYFIT